MFDAIPFPHLLILFAALALPHSASADAEPQTDQPAGDEEPDDSDWTPLFDGESLEDWKVTEFGGEGPVEVEDGVLIIGRGQPLSGITWDGGEIPRVNYEIRLQAKRIEGSDFFCALTFPVQDDVCTLVLGGWGGSLTGLSSLNGADASENQTTDFYAFEEGRWYDVRLVVTEHTIQAWLDDVQLADVDYTQLEVGIRFEMELSRPLGVATYNTVGALRDFRIRELSADEAAAIDAEAG